MAALIPDDLDALLTRVPLAEALTAVGFPVSDKTLATKASRGGGPPFQKFGPRALYRWGSALEWAQSKLGPVVRSTAELDIAPQQELKLASQLTTTAKTSGCGAVDDDFGRAARSVNDSEFGSPADDMGRDRIAGGAGLEGDHQRVGPAPSSAAHHTLAHRPA